MIVRYVAQHVTIPLLKKLGRDVSEEDAQRISRRFVVSFVVFLLVRQYLTQYMQGRESFNHKNILIASLLYALAKEIMLNV
jgi:hypothetical protein